MKCASCRRKRIAPTPMKLNMKFMIGLGFHLITFQRVRFIIRNQAITRYTVKVNNIDHISLASLKIC